MEEVTVTLTRKEFEEKADKASDNLMHEFMDKGMSLNGTLTSMLTLSVGFDELKIILFGKEEKENN